eukprot:gnl/TRDRNA2_/TRDRNA2_183853_c0_seq1.p1 gnl/TRDRNA2_/TRDRNA2_183853_c0~~gnl/TRDRNA2_/TRDRNA2_183853_c0_seq1.p1  ORF type:complete len:127 (+),score=30.13 gnl/TRDRNA2_/TRDRNA2_183853_c0_seq1:104-484(+)
MAALMRLAAISIVAVSCVSAAYLAADELHRHQPLQTHQRALLSLRSKARAEADSPKDDDDKKAKLDRAAQRVEKYRREPHVDCGGGVEPENCDEKKEKKKSESAALSLFPLPAAGTIVAVSMAFAM